MATKVGPALKLSDKDLEEAAQITEEDIERANERWQKSAPRKWANILVAENA